MNKELPTFADGEKAIIGGMILDNTKIPQVINTLNLDDFYFERNRIIYSAIDNLHEDGQPVDWATLTNELKMSATLDTVGGQSFIADIVGAVPSAANIMHYVQIVKEKSDRRRLIAKTQEILTEAFEEAVPLDELQDEFQKAAFTVRGDKGVEDFGGLEPISAIMARCLTRLQSGKASGIQSGFRAIDQFTAGFEPGNLVIIAGNPSHGKTALAVNIAQNLVCGQTPIPVTFFSLEMSKEAQAERILSSKTPLDLLKIRRKEITEFQSERLESTSKRFEKLPLYIDETGGITPSRIRSRLRELAIRTKQPAQLVIIDYLQLMRADEKYDSEHARLNSITKALKQMAKQFRVPVICLSQLNREVDRIPVTSKNKDSHPRKPQIQHLRGSGSIEEDADVVIGVYRAERYDEYKEPEYTGKAWIPIMKQRNGPVGVAKLYWDAATATFRDPAPDNLCEP